MRCRSDNREKKSECWESKVSVIWKIGRSPTLSGLCSRLCVISISKTENPLILSKDKL